MITSSLILSTLLRFTNQNSTLCIIHPGLNNYAHFFSIDLFYFTNKLGKTDDSQYKIVLYVCKANKDLYLAYIQARCIFIKSISGDVGECQWRVACNGLTIMSM